MRLFEKKTSEDYTRNLRPLEEKGNYRDFSVPDACDKWGTTYYKEWSNHYRSVMLAATNHSFQEEIITENPIERYLGYDYRSINRNLRTGDPQNRDMALIINLALCSAPRIPENVVVYRVVDDEMIQALLAEVKEGKMYCEEGFLSTSLLMQSALNSDGRGKNLLKLYVKKGTIGIYANTIAHRGEFELLLINKLWLGLIENPYIDEETGYHVYECCVFDFYVEMNPQ